jgi:hypothetical protein
VFIKQAISVVEKGECFQEMPTRTRLFRLVEEGTGAPLPDSETHAKLPQALASAAEQALSVSSSDRLVVERWDEDSREWIPTAVRFSAS